MRPRLRPAFGSVGRRLVQTGDSVLPLRMMTQGSMDDDNARDRCAVADDEPVAAVSHDAAAHEPGPLQRPLRPYANKQDATRATASTRAAPVRHL